MSPEPFFAPEVDISHIKTEDDTPVDNVFSEKQQRLLTEPLYSSWSGPGEGRTFAVFSNVGVFFSPKKPPVVPDVFLSLDVEIDPDPWAKAHRSYFVWEYGKVPDIVIEVVSNREGGEADTKFNLYRQLHVPTYVIHDPEKHLSEDELRVFVFSNSFYRQTDDFWFEDLQLGLTLWEGAFEGVEGTWLRWCDREGKVIPAGFEERQRAQTERQRAEAERQRAEAEQQRAETERQRAEAEQQRAETERQRAETERQRALAAEEKLAKLSARLTALGVDPEGV